MQSGDVIISNRDAPKRMEEQLPTLYVRHVNLGIIWQQVLLVIICLPSLVSPIAWCVGILITNDYIPPLSMFHFIPYYCMCPETRNGDPLQVMLFTPKLCHYKYRQ